MIDLQDTHRQIEGPAVMKDRLMVLSRDDLDEGTLLGSGAFGSVFKVRLRENPSRQVSSNEETCYDSKHSDEEDLTGATSASSSSSSSSPGRSSITSTEGEFAMKKVSAEHLSDPDAAHDAVQAIRVELDLLRQIPDHENIIHLCGYSEDFDENPEDGFLLLELLSETLEERMKRWKNPKPTYNRTSSSSTSILQRAFGRNNTLNAEQQLSRVSMVGVGLARAMSFLHKHKILYRDLKPANLGFDKQGGIRLFDFGLARRYDKNDQSGQNLTLCVGSLRYMSAEVANGDGYSFSSDVHSFCILLWEVCALQKPFSQIKSPDDLFKHVFMGHRRPSLKAIKLKDIKDLLRFGWHPDPQVRPMFEPISSVLHQVCNSQA